MSASCVTRCLTLRQSSCVTWLSTASRGWEAHSNALFVLQVRQSDPDKPLCAWLDPEMTHRGVLKYSIPFLGRGETTTRKAFEYDLTNQSYLEGRPFSPSFLILGSIFHSHLNLLVGTFRIISVFQCAVILRCGRIGSWCGRLGFRFLDSLDLANSPGQVTYAKPWFSISKLSTSDHSYRIDKIANVQCS